jgi:hypothetical protein
MASDPRRVRRILEPACRRVVIDDEVRRYLPDICQPADDQPNAAAAVSTAAKISHRRVGDAQSGAALVGVERDVARRGRSRSVGRGALA